jgi:hypothetical protein
MIMGFIYFRDAAKARIPQKIISNGNPPVPLMERVNELAKVQKYLY